MSSFFDSASLVQIPSGYKVGTLFSVKPIDGSGDLTFTRSNDTATRVGPDGLIQKVYTNVLTYSNTFSDASWTKTNATITANDAVSPEGATNASKYEGTNATNALTKITTLANGFYTFSIYVKRIATDNFRMNFSDGVTGEIRYVFNLTNETSTLVKSGGSISDWSSNYVALSNGWYRLSITAKTNAGSTVHSYIEADNEVGSFYIFGAQLEVSDFGATDYIATTTAAVSVGPVANLPRLDYSGGATCPKLLLEGQRTNLVTFSENLDNADWDKSGNSVTPNDDTSPDGYTNADKIQGNGTQSFILAKQDITFAATGNYAFSIYAKAGNNDFLRIQFNGVTGGLSGYFDLANGTTSSSGASIELAANGFYRCTLVNNLTGPDLSGRIDVYCSYSDSASTFPSAGDANGQYIHLWGAQLEAGAYATSYIPTLGAAVTRGADACFNNSVASLIGQPNGSVFLDFVYQNNFGNTRIFSISGASWITNGSIRLEKTGTKFRWNWASGGSATGALTSTTDMVIGQRYKIAITYTATTASLFVNGVKENTASVTTPTSMLQVHLNELGGGFTDANEFQSNSFNQVLLFTQTLTDTQAIELTA